MAKLPMNAYNWTWQGISLHFFLKKISRLKSKVSIFSHYSELPLTYCSEEDKRVLCQLLNKLYIPDVADRYRIRSMKLLMVNLRAVSSSSSLSCHCLIECILQRRPLRDHASKTAFSKFETAFTKKFEKLLEDFSEEEFRKLEELDEYSCSWIVFSLQKTKRRKLTSPEKEAEKGAMPNLSLLWC